MPIPTWLLELCIRLEARDEELINLNLNIRRFDQEMMQQLALALRQNNTLKVLNLTSSVANDTSALEPLIQFMILPNHSSLQVLHLSYNRLTNVAPLGIALRQNKCLLELHLEYNRIGSDSAIAIAQGLYENTTLQVLKLNYNQIGDAGCTAIAKSLAQNSTLRKLGLNRNAITSIGTLDLIDMLKNNTTLQQIDLDDVSIPKRQKHLIHLTCRANHVGRKHLTNSGGGAGAGGNCCNDNNNDNTQKQDMWPLFLEKCRREPDLLYFFIKSHSDVFVLYSGRCSVVSTDNTTHMIIE